MFESKKSIYIFFLILVAAFSCLTYIHDAIDIALSSNFGDFGNYYFYSRALRLKYDIFTLDETTTSRLQKEFKMPNFVPKAGHSPAFFFLIRGISFFDYSRAYLIWFVLNNIFLLFSALIILKLVTNTIENIDKKFIILSSLFLLFSFQPLIEHIALGQLGLLILILFCLCLYFLGKKQYELSGIFLGLGILIKPHLAVLLPFFLWKRCYRVFFSGLFSFVFIDILATLLTGIKDTSYWPMTIDNFFIKYLTNFSMNNLSLGAWINRLFNIAANPAAINIALSLNTVFSLGLFLYLVYITRGRFKVLNPRFILEFSLVIIFICIVFPVVHEHHYVLFYLPIIFIWSILTRDIRIGRSFVFIVAFLLIGLKYSLNRFPMFYGGPLSIFSGGKLLGATILFFLTAHLIRIKDTTVIKDID